MTIESNGGGLVIDVPLYVLAARGFVPEGTRWQSGAGVSSLALDQKVKGDGGLVEDVPWYNTLRLMRLTRVIAARWKEEVMREMEEEDKERIDQAMRGAAFIYPL